MIKGVALDDDRLKQGSNLLDKDYVKEFLLFAQVKGEYFAEVGVIYGN